MNSKLYFVRNLCFLDSISSFYSIGNDSDIFLYYYKTIIPDCICQALIDLLKQHQFFGLNKLTSLYPVHIYTGANGLSIAVHGIPFDGFITGFLESVH